MNQDQLRNAARDFLSKLSDSKNYDSDLSLAMQFGEECAALTATQQAAPYGYCPICGAKGEMRERRMDGNDTCANGHNYKSSKAVQQAAPSQGAGEMRVLAYKNESAAKLTYGDLRHLFEQSAIALRQYASLLEASTQREQPAQAMQRWQIMPTVKVRSTNQELSVTGVYEDVVFVDLPEQPAASKPMQQTHRYKLELPDGDSRTAKVFWSEHSIDGAEIHHHLCIDVPETCNPEPQAQAGEPETFDTSNMDAMHWAKAFASRFTVWSQQHGVESDTAGLMLGWFANAIMAGYDEASRRNSEAIDKKDAALKACVEALIYLRNSQNIEVWPVEADSAIEQGMEAIK